MKTSKRLKYFTKRITLYFKNLKEQKMKFKNLINKYDSYLVPGKYIVSKFAGKNIAYLKNEDTLKFIKKGQSSSTNHNLNYKSLRSIFKKINTLIFRIKKRNGFDGAKHCELIMYSYNGNIKLYSFKYSKVYTFMSNENYNKLKKDINVFCDFFPTTYCRFEDSKSLTIEKLIDYKPVEIWREKDRLNIIKYTMENYISYMEIASIGKINFNTLVDEYNRAIKNNKLKTIINENIEVFKNKHFITIYSHCDMHFGNVLISDKHYYIDWEYASDVIFFYDIMNILFVEAMRGDYSLIESYLQGHYDEYFTKLFIAANSTYNKDDKTEYIWVYIIVRILKFEIKINKNKIDDIYKRYIIMMEKIENISKKLKV